MIESIDVMCRIWGVQKRRIVTGANEFGDPDGWPRETVLARIREMQYNAGARHGYVVRHFAETYTDPDALAIHRASQGMPEGLKATLYMHYVVPQHRKLAAKRKAALLNQSLRDYWINLDRAHHWLAGRVETLRTAATAEHDD